MQINRIPDYLRNFHRSHFFPMSLAFCSFFIWALNEPFSWFFVAIYILLAFVPLFDQDGRGYMPLLVFTFIVSFENISFNSLSPQLITLVSVVLASLILYIIIHKPKLRTGSIFFSLLILFLIFFISFLIFTIRERTSDSAGILYILLLVGACVIYALISSVLGRGETYPYLCRTAAFFAIAISTEIFYKLLITTGIGFAAEDFSLGWAYTKDTISTLLCLCFPLIGSLVHQKKIGYVFAEVYVLSALILLFTHSSILAILLLIVPFVLFSLKDTSNYYQYFVLGTLFIVGGTIGLLMGMNSEFNSAVVSSIRSLLFWDKSNDNYYLLEKAANLYTQNFIFGASINSSVITNGTLLLAPNTVMNTAQWGGTVGLVSYLGYEIALYLEFARKKSGEKWLYFLFLLVIEIIGLTSTSIYNISVLIFALITISCYHQSNRPKDVIIHQNYFENKNKKL